jgi:hypothetical protein
MLHTGNCHVLSLGFSLDEKSQPPQGEKLRTQTCMPSIVTIEIVTMVGIHNVKSKK